MKVFYFLFIAVCSTVDVYPQSKAIFIRRDSLLKAETTSFHPKNSNPFALVAGGSKGIGYAIAEALALRQYNLILVARHHTPLLEAKEKLENKYNIQVEIMSYDLSKRTSAAEISKWCIKNDIPLKMLCNVAGLGGTNDYLKVPLDTLYYMVNLNIESCMSLSLQLLPLLEKNAPSFILNVSSMAGFAPIPSKNMYSATKSAVTFFSYNLRHQLKKRNISVSCLHPGPVFTKPSIKADTKRRLGFIGMQMAVPPSRVGETAVRETLNGKMIIVPGTLAKITSGFTRIMPRGMLASIYGSLGEE
ncbi:SDR family NAD(P)-dependent oxidoreductase [Chryseolinea sp. H1M3-3]|uniref:SDR family NAD(P)-dependent oxidoreductase n=1 Tax=Chryseolinea sp. H1M3-3 TaxID=3034144 RepID=UPI0023ECA49F|nr:SDR family NAD(P)-dependent oxidoreductase [Chryseolinea sp. H1M3-3]